MTVKRTNGEKERNRLDGKEGTGLTGYEAASSQKGSVAKK